MKKLNFYASEPHYLDHLIPIYLAFPPDRRGKFIVLNEQTALKASLDYDYRECVLTRDVDFGLSQLLSDPRDKENPFLVASILDATIIKQHNRPVILMAHGSGQTYQTSASTGEEGRDFIGLFLTPNKESKIKQIKAYPKIPCYTIGCPKLDAYKDREPTKDLTVGISFHHSGLALTPETTTSWMYFWNKIEKLIRDNPHVTFYGHAHPKLQRTLIAKWQSIPNCIYTNNFNDILRKCNYYICDNSSTIFEMAAIGRPVMLLNSPQYRKDVNHGMRFWDYADIGVQCEFEDDMQVKFNELIKDPKKYQTNRIKYTKKIYSEPVGQATPKAIKVLIGFLDNTLDKFKVKEVEKSMIQMKALVTEISDEGQLIKGEVFFPGYKNKRIQVDGTNINVAETLMTWSTPKQRAHILFCHKKAVYLNDQEEIQIETTSEDLTPKKRRKLNGE